MPLLPLLQPVPPSLQHPCKAILSNSQLLLLLASAAGAPDAPTFSNRMGNSVRVKWQPPAEDNGAPVVEYVLEMLGPAAKYFQNVYEGESTSCRVQQLAPGTEYQFRVRAANAVGVGPHSAVSSVSTTSAPPSPPGNVLAALAGGATEGAAGSGASSAPSVVVSWEPAPQGDMQATCISYEIDAAPALLPASSGRMGEAGMHHKAAGPAAAPAVRQTCSAKVLQHALAGLQPGATYWVRVRGIGAGGSGHGEWSEPAAVQLPAVERATAASGCGGSGSGDEEGEAAAVHSKRRKSRSGSAAEGQGKAHRAQAIGAWGPRLKGWGMQAWGPRWVQCWCPWQRIPAC